MIYVETIEATTPNGELAETSSGLPEGEVREVGFFDTLATLETAIKDLSNSIRKALQEAQPNEFSVQLNFGLKGGIQVIPVLLKGSAEGSIKVKVKWTRADPTPVAAQVG
jgi:hypothetical protein